MIPPRLIATPALMAVMSRRLPGYTFRANLYFSPLTFRLPRKIVCTAARLFLTLVVGVSELP